MVYSIPTIISMKEWKIGRPTTATFISKESQQLSRLEFFKSFATPTTPTVEQSEIPNFNKLADLCRLDEFRPESAKGFLNDRNKYDACRVYQMTSECSKGTT
jgi:hypothetical protein